MRWVWMYALLIHMDAAGVNVLAAWLLAAGDDVRTSAATTGLSTGKAAALVLVSNNPGCSVDWLRARMGLTHSGTVRLVDRLAGADLLRRGTATHDGRAVALTTTSAGDEQVAQIHAVRTGVITRLLEDLPEATAAALLEVATVQLRSTPRNNVQADVTCRLCRLASCLPHCPVDESVPQPPDDRHPEGAS